MSKQVIINQVILEFRGDFGLANNLALKLERRLQHADWNELLKPILRGIGVHISVADSAAPKRAKTVGRRNARNARRPKGSFCVEIARVAAGSHVFHIPNTTQAGAIKAALAQAGDHGFSERTADYEVQAVWRQR